MFTTQEELEAAFYAAYPQHKRFDVTEASAIDWTDWYDAMCRANRVKLPLISDSVEETCEGYLPQDNESCQAGAT